jgi:ribonuclease D
VISVQVIDNQQDFQVAKEAIFSGTGPLAIDAERASGFTYSQRAYLIQIHRRNAGTFLFDAPALGDMSSLFSPLADQEWVLHAASQDLPCLREVGIDPLNIFDTELSARLLGMNRVGLGPVVEELLGVHLKKEHSAADWSTRPLPESWLTYAALDVELLVDLRDALEALLIESGKREWAQEEFNATLAKPEKPQLAEPWRKLSGLHTLAKPQQLAIARSLWSARDQLAQDRDISPGRLIPDSSITAVSKLSLTSIKQMANVKEFSGRASRSELPLWWEAYVVGSTDKDLPVMRIPSDSIPAPRVWAEKNPAAFQRLSLAKEMIHATAENLQLPVENLLTPSILREVSWSPPDEITHESVSAKLSQLGARSWQIEITSELIFGAFVDAHQKIQQNLPVDS